MKKNSIKIIIIVNLILLIAILICSEIHFYKNYPKNAFWVMTEDLPYWHNEEEDIVDISLEGAKYPERFHFPTKQYEKEPVLLLGCSYTYGQYLSEEENLSGLIQKLTNRHVYNMGSIAKDPTLSLMLLDRFSKDKGIKQKPKYIIYTYMFHHLQRLHAWGYFDFYRIRGYIPFQKYNPLYRLYTYSYFQNRYLDERLLSSWDFARHQKIFFNIVKDMKKAAREMNPDSEVVVLIYNDINYDLVPNLWNTVQNNEYKMNKLFEIQESEEFKKELEKAGAIVISTKDLIGRRMDRPEDRVADDPNHPHPSAKAWQIIVPKLVERLKL